MNSGACTSLRSLKTLRLMILQNTKAMTHTGLQLKFNFFGAYVRAGFSAVTGPTYPLVVLHDVVRAVVYRRSRKFPYSLMSFWTIVLNIAGAMAGNRSYPVVERASQRVRS